MKDSVFHSATLRLAAWYTLIIFCMSVLFSVVLFQISSHELRRGYRPPRPGETMIIQTNGDTVDDFFSWREERIHETQTRLMWQLALFNLLVVVAGAGGSYLLARRTLRPVEQALEGQTRFSSDAAHELRTPLTIMQSEIEIGLRDHRATKTSHAALLRSNLDEVAHMRTLTDRLLQLANNHDIVLQPTSLEDIAIDAVSRVVPLAQSKHITIKNSVQNISVLGNHDSLVDVVCILLENAIKYSPPKSTISMHAEKKGKNAIFRVSDTGPGIPTKDLPHVFDRFYRADTSRSSQHVSGHGLGLSIAQQIVAAHHGRLTAANNLDKGALFTITLPLT